VVPKAFRCTLAGFDLRKDDVCLYAAGVFSGSRFAMGLSRKLLCAALSKNIRDK
jgi:hypothetical protein